MADRNEIIKLAVDAYHGSVENYSVEQSQETLRKALVAANGGSTILNYKRIRNGECKELFSIVEEILNRTVAEGLQDNDFFNALVEYRDISLGDENLFVIEDNNLYIVAEIAEGTQAVRRQRLGGQRTASIPTSLKAVRIYEELNRVLAGRVDFNYMISKVAESFKQKLLEEIYALWSGVTAEDLGGVAYFPEAGTYDEDELLDLIAHVEAASGGKTATIVCTKKAARNLLPGIILGVEAKSDLYNQGYIGKFYGTPVVVVPNRHKIGTTEFVLDDSVLTIIAGDDKPIKVVREGESLIILGNPMDNMDLTQEYFCAERWGCGLVLAGGKNTGIGRFVIAE